MTTIPHLRTMQVIPYTAEHLDAPIWSSSDEYERMIPRLRWHVHTPYAQAWCTVHYEDLTSVGMAVRFGDHARITVCKTVNEHDAATSRELLVTTLLAELTAQGCTGFTITVAPEQVGMWEAFGFTAQEQLLRYAGGRFLQATRDEVIHFEPFHRMGLLHLDRQASGEDRSTLLMEHSYLGSVYMEGNRMRGFSLPLLGEGLIIADAPEVGLELQRWLFPIQEHILLPAGNAAHAHLTKQDYVATPVGVRMVRGIPLEVRSAMCFGEVWGCV